MNRKTIAVLFGGCSTEYEISLESASSVIDGIDRDQYDVVLLGITRRGRWLLYGGGTGDIRDNTWMDHPSCLPAVLSPDRGTHGILMLDGEKVTALPIDAAFPVLHGKNGEDGTVQGLLELAGIPCAGCGLLSSALCMDKDVAHRLAGLAGIKTPRSMVLCAPLSDGELLRRAAALRYPLFVKPANAGSSFGITRVTAIAELPAAVEAAFVHDRKVIVEEAVPGFEVGCAVLGDGTLTIGEVDEIELSWGFFDYTEKYTLKSSRIHMPARIGGDTAQRIKDTAAVIYRTLECSGFARVDLFLTPEGDIVFNEVNTIPGFTSHSRYPAMLGGVGLSMERIVNEIIRLAVEK